MWEHDLAGGLRMLRMGVDTHRYGVTDADGSRPDAWGYIAAYGMEEQSGKDVERFR
jgi:hypothetical protein